MTAKICTEVSECAANLWDVRVPVDVADVVVGQAGKEIDQMLQSEEKVELTPGTWLTL